MLRLIFFLFSVVAAHAQVGPLPGSGPSLPFRSVTATSPSWVITDFGGTGAIGPNVTLTGNIPSGVLMVVGIYESCHCASPGTVSDSNNDAFNLIASQNNNNSTLNGVTALYYFVSTTPITSLVYTMVTSGEAAVISALYATGQITNPLDTTVTAKSAGQGTTGSVTSGTPSVSGDLFIGWNAPLGATSSTWVQDAAHNWTSTGGLDPGVINTAFGQGGNQINAGTSTVIFAPTWTSNHNWATIVAGFKP